MTSIKIVPVEFSDKEVLRNLMEFYLYDFSEIENFDVHSHGRFEYKYLDHYWTESSRYPFFILVEGHYAGFILVRQLEETQTNSIAEFFVMRKYRRQGIGATAAKRIFDHFPGKWEVSQVKNNIKAKAFWHKVIGEYTNNIFEETNNENGVTTQLFSISSIEGDY